MISSRTIVLALMLTALAGVFYLSAFAQELNTEPSAELRHARSLHGWYLVRCKVPATVEGVQQRCDPETGTVIGEWYSIDDCLEHQRGRLSKAEEGVVDIFVCSHSNKDTDV